MRWSWPALAVLLALALAWAPGQPSNAATALPGTDISGDPEVVASTTAPDLPPAPKVSAAAWAVYDGTDGTRLAGLDADEPRPIASLTKIMTALVVTKRTRGDERVRVTEQATEVGDGAALGIKAGQRYRVDDLLRATLVYSANDAARALAEHVGGEDGEEGFIELMNDEAEGLDLETAVFRSTTGLPPAGGAKDETVASPSDLVELTEVALREPRIREAVRTEQVTIKRPGEEPAILGNRNLLLGEYAGVDGVKTGHTDAAGYCLLTHYDDQDGRELWVVYLGGRTESSRVEETRRLLDWAVPLRQLVPVIAAGDPVATAPVAGDPRPVRLFASSDVEVSVRVGERMKERVVVTSPVQPPLREGDELGRIEVVVDGEVIGRSPLYVDRTLREVDTWTRVRTAAGDWRVAAEEGWEEVDRRTRGLREDLGA
jgi:serine-type D-Ala-D-Ala carboxypeptidase (penicillin-binding protein 5/6)